VLRRVAGSLFWAGRYLERAQWNARVVDVNYNLLLEVPPRDVDPWEPLVQITGQYEAFSMRHSRADEAAVIDFFTFDRENPSSTRNCVESVRNGLSPLRHLISSELWMAVNRLYLETQQWSAQTLAASGVFGFFSDLSDRFYTIMGIIANTLPRDSAYDLIEIGIMIERADNVARMLDVKYHYLLPRLDDIGGSSDMRQWGAVLRSASALEAFRKMHGNRITIERTVDYLVFEPVFPRSIRFSIESLHGALFRTAAAGAERPAMELPCADLLATLRAGCAADVIGGGLHEFLLYVQSQCAHISDTIAEQYMSLD
jgi:uncharacterized alpha-E superfamily protein